MYVCGLMCVCYMYGGELCGCYMPLLRWRL